MSIYVEILIRAPMDVLWVHTQTPELHERWDLRFTRIEYLPRRGETEPQRFRYATRIGFGLEVTGEGENVGERDSATGARTSALKFSSDDRRSIIRAGRGYWKYMPTEEGVRFLTLYDYQTRFGVLGRAFDRIVFRPLLGWATAWSFDCLRLWIEDGTEPAHALRQWAARSVARVGVALIFAYHGLVPKLLGPHSDEVAMVRDLGVPAERVNAMLTGLGVGELLFAACALCFWNRRWPVLLALAGMCLSTIVIALNSPRYLGAAFNPISLNLAVATLALVDLFLLRGLPSASRCWRRPAIETS